MNIEAINLNKNQKNFNKQIFNKIGPFLGLILISLFFSLTTTQFLTVGNLLTVALQTSTICLLAIAETYVVITSGIDLSVGSILAVAGVVCGQLLLAGAGIPIAVFVGIAIGGILGLINGFIIAKLGIAPFIATLGTMSIARGAAYVITNSLPVSGLPEAFYFIGGGTVFGIIPVPVMIMIIMSILFGFILKKTVFGKCIYAVGSNKDAARLSGINVKKTLIGVYGVSGVLCGLVGVILASRLVSAQPQAGLGYEMDGIAAAVIGGVSLMGGSGTVVGTVIGSLIIGILRNGLNLLNINAFWQQIVIGIVIIGAVYVDKLRRK